LFLESFSAFAGDLVVLCFSVVLGESPGGGDGAVEFEAVERGVEGSFFDLEDFVGEEVDGLGDGVAVEGSTLESVKDEEIEGALEEIGRFGHSVPMRI